MSATRRGLQAFAATFVVGCSGAPSPEAVTIGPAGASLATSAETVTYCAYLLDLRGDHQCAAPLDGARAARREATWVIRRANGVLTSIALENSVGEPVNSSNGTARVEYQIEKGRLTSATDFAATGRRIAHWLFSPDGSRAENRDANGAFVVDPFTGAEIVESQFDAAGRLVQTRFLDRDGHPATPGGVVATRFERDAEGFIVASSTFDAAEHPIVNSRGCMVEKFERDALGNRIAARCFDERGQPSLDLHGVHLVRKNAGPAGNIAEERYFGIDGPTTSEPRTTIHRIAYVRNAEGRVAERTTFDLADNPTENENGFARVSYVYGDKGRVLSEAFFDASLAPRADRKHGGARTQFVRDAQGRPIEHHLFAPDGTLFGIRAMTFDERDREIEVKCLDADRRPHRCLGKATGWQNAFDERNRIVERHYVDASGAAAETKEQVAFIKTSYAPSGKKTEESFNANGAPVLPRLGAKHLVVFYKGSTRAPAGVTRTNAEAKRRAEEALAKIKHGMSFDAAVIAYSDDPSGPNNHGDLGEFRRGVMAKPFEEAVIKLEPGQMSDVVETPFGFHVIVRTQ